MNLAFPLEPGSYLVVNGGSDFKTNAHILTLDASEPRFRDWRGQSYGVDLVKLDGLPDMQVPEMDREHMAGNHVMLRCAKADGLLAHFSPGSIQVGVGMAVAVGVWLGSVGNSGNTGEPHLHIHAQRPGPAGTPMGGNPLPILLGGHFPVRGERIGQP